MLLLAVPAYANESYQLEIDKVGRLHVQVSSFIQSDHDVVSCGDFVCAIDGAPFFGSDGKIPQHKLSRMRFFFGDTEVNLDVDSMFDPGLSKENISNRIFIKHYWGGFYKVTGKFSDGAGSYIAEWLISKHGALRTTLSSYEMFFDLYQGVDSAAKP